MNDIELLQLRVMELEEIIAKLRLTLKFTYQEVGLLKQGLTDIANQSRDSNEKTLAKLCLEELRLT